METPMSSNKAHTAYDGTYVTTPSGPDYVNRMDCPHQLPCGGYPCQIMGKCPGSEGYKITWSCDNIEGSLSTFELEVDVDGF